MSSEAVAGGFPKFVPSDMPAPKPIAEDFSHSATIGKIALALSKAQGAMENASKDKVNPHFKSRYADMAAVVDAARAPLAANELALVQPVTTPKSGGVRVVTMLMHSSGEWMRSDCTFPVGQQTAQGYGSAITYCRRYCEMAMLGMAPDEDDDGNAASQQVFRPEPSNGTPSQGKRTADLKAKLSAKAARETEQSLPSEPPPHNPQTGEVVEPENGPEVPAGQHAGTPISELSDKQLAGYLKLATEGNGKSPLSRPQWKAAVEAEISRRSK